MKHNLLCLGEEVSIPVSQWNRFSSWFLKSHFTLLQPPPIKSYWCTQTIENGGRETQ